MTKRQLEKIRKQYEELDYSRWHILGYDELLKINGGSSASSDDDDEGEKAESITEEESGETDEAEATAETASESGGHEIENTVEAVANAEVGDTLTRDDGTQVTITQEDIDWAQEHCDSGKNKDDEDESPENKSGEEVPEAMPPEEESAQSSDGADTAEQGALSGDEKSSSADSKSDSRQNEGADEGKPDGKEGASSSKENGSAKESNSGKESSNTKENASSSKKSDSPDLVERARQRDEELSAKKNSELNNGSKAAGKNVEEHFINRYTYVPMENIGLNGGTNYHVTTVKTENNLSVFATGHFIGENLVNDYKPCGTVDLLVDGNKVQSQSFTPPSSAYVWDGEGKVIGEANFNYDFTNVGSVSLDFYFGIFLEQDSQGCSIDYGTTCVDLK